MADPNEPTANADTASVAANATVTGNVLTNDTDPDLDPLNVSSVDQGVNLVGQAIAGQYGTLILNADGSYTYTANNSAPAGAPVTDTFTYTVTDHHGGSEALFANFDAPDYALGSINGQQGWTVTGPFDHSVVSDGPDQGLHFTRQVTSGGFAEQLFSPALTQTAGEPSAPGTVTSFFEASWTMTPQALETSADAQNSFIGISMDNGTGARGNLLRLVNDGSGNWVLHAFDFSQGDFTDTVVAELPVGVATKIGFTQQFVDGSGNDVWKVYVNDQLFFTGTGWEDFGNNSLVSYDQLLFRASGSAVIGDQGVIIDDVSFTTNQQSTLTVSVQGNNAPVNTVPGAQTVDEDTALLIAGVLVADDSPTLTTTLTVLSGTLNVTAGAGIINGNGTTEVEIVGTAAEINAALAGLSYTGNLNFNGSDTLTVLTSDGVLTDTDTVAITVSPVNDEPTANADTASVAANATVTGNVLTNDTDPDLDPLNVSSVDQGVNLVGQAIAGQYGTLILNADGSYTYTANNSAPAGAPVTDTFTYTVTDHHGGSEALFANFDAPDYALGSINGQQGWTVTGPFDHSVVSDGPDQGLHFTRQVTSGGFAEQLFSPALTQTAGEPSAPGTVTSFFEASWTMTPQALETSADAQNSFIGISMDNGTGARGNLLRLVNDGSGNWVLHAFDFSQGDFTDTVVAELPVGVATKIGFTQQFVDGSGNDVWKVYVNDQLFFTGTGWEDFGNNSLVSYDQLLFRASGSAVIGDQGVIIDDVSFTTNQQSTLTVSVQGNALTEHAHCDFDGDSGSDILWQDNNGTASMWLMDGPNATFVGAVGTNPGPSWEIKATGDFNGDGKADIIWQGDDGTASMWLMDGHDATFVGAVGKNPGPSWHIEGTGDFNGDGKDDIIWQGDNGTASMWLMDGTNPTFVGAVGTNPGPAWHIEGTGDFNGDGKDDIIWQGDNGTASMWLMDGHDATFVGAVGTNPGPTWHIKGTGDFNGDGKDDIIWQGDNGAASIWLMDGTNPTFVGAVGTNPGPTWHIEGTGDFNGDGKSDIMWQGQDGTAAVWLMDGSNATVVGAVGPFNPGATWDIIA